MCLTRMYRELMKVANVDGDRSVCAGPSRPKSPSTWAAAQAQQIVEILSPILSRNLNKMQLEAINHYI